MTLTITTIAAIILGVIYLAQTFSVVAIRLSAKIVLGDGDNKTATKRIRGHGNSAEQIPLFLILLGLVESQTNIGATLISLLAVLFVVGRLLHASYFLDMGLPHQFRRYGMIMTLFGQILAITFLAIGMVTG